MNANQEIPSIYMVFNQREVLLQKIDYKLSVFVEITILKSIDNYCMEQKF